MLLLYHRRLFSVSPLCLSRVVLSPTAAALSRLALRGRVGRAGAAGGPGPCVVLSGHLAASTSPVARPSPSLRRTPTFRPLSPSLLPIRPPTMHRSLLSLALLASPALAFVGTAPLVAWSSSSCVPARRSLASLRVEAAADAMWGTSRLTVRRLPLFADQQASLALRPRDRSWTPGRL